VSRGAAQRPVLLVIKPKKAGGSSVAKTHWYSIKGCRVDVLAVYWGYGMDCECVG
jgi:hypothetical protein